MHFFQDPQEAGGKMTPCTIFFVFLYYGSMLNGPIFDHFYLFLLALMEVLALIQFCPNLLMSLS